MLGFPGKKVTTQGIPVLAENRGDIIAHAKGLGIADVPDANVSKRAFKQFTDRLNAAKTAQRTGEVGTEGEEKGLKQELGTKVGGEMEGKDIEDQKSSNEGEKQDENLETKVGGLKEGKVIEDQNRPTNEREENEPDKSVDPNNFFERTRKN